jgi:hypothetical protein
VTKKRPSKNQRRREREILARMRAEPPVKQKLSLTVRSGGAPLREGLPQLPSWARRPAREE